VVACGAGPTFTCLSSDDCGANGVCEANGGCSFPDPSCDSGRRFARYTASANACVPEQGSTSGGESTDTLEFQTTTSSGEGGTSTGEHTSSTTVDIVPSSTSGPDESSSGNVSPFDFYDDFERPDSSEVGNGWVEKTPGAFALIDGGIQRVGSMLSYPNNLVYRPDGAWLDAEAIVELVWFDVSTDYGSPQCVLRTQPEDIDVPNSVTGYLLFVDGTSGDLTITRQIDGAFTQQHSAPLTADPELGAPHRLRLHVAGVDPVTLDGYLELLVDGAWVPHTEVHGTDDTPERIITPGTFAVGGHQQLGLWTYEATSVESLD